MRDAFAFQELRVASVEDVPLGEGRTVTVAGRPLAVFQTETGWYAVDNTCTHMGGPLADGIVADDSVACPLHDRRFELATGDPIGHECGAVAAYPVDVRDGEVFLGVPVIKSAMGEGEVASVNGAGAERGGASETDEDAEEDGSEAPS